MVKIKLTRYQKVVLFVLKHAQDLKDGGIIKRRYELSSEGKKDAETLIKSGFKPTNDEFEDCMKKIINSDGKSKT